MGCTNEAVKFLVVLGTGLGQPGGTGCRGGLGAGWLPRDGAAETLSQKFRLKTEALCLGSSCALQLLHCCMESREEAPD